MENLLEEIELTKQQTLEANDIQIHLPRNLYQKITTTHQYMTSNIQMLTYSNGNTQGYAKFLAF